MTIDDGERPHGGAVVPSSAGIGYNGRFAVWLRRVKMRPSPGSRASETDTESLFSSAPRSEAPPEVEVDSESQFVFVPAPAVSPSFCSHPVRVHCFGHIERAGGHCSQGMRDEGASGFPPWCVQVGHAVGIARDCEWHGDPESVSDLQRVAVVYLASENFVVPSCTRWQSAQEPAS